MNASEWFSKISELSTAQIALIVVGIALAVVFRALHILKNNRKR
jgi:hypothetical protein